MVAFPGVRFLPLPARQELTLVVPVGGKEAKDRIIALPGYHKGCLVIHLHRKCSPEKTNCLAASLPVALGIAVSNIAAVVGRVAVYNRYLVKGTSKR